MIIAVIPPVAALLGIAILCHNHFALNTNEFLTLFLPVVWALMVALGGSFVLLNKAKGHVDLSEVQKSISEALRPLCLILVVQTLIFILVACLFPVRHYIADRVIKLDWNYVAAASAADSTMFVNLLIPGTFSILIGAWSLYVTHKVSS